MEPVQRLSPHGALPASHQFCVLGSVHTDATHIIGSSRQPPCKMLPASLPPRRPRKFQLFPHLASFLPPVRMKSPVPDAGLSPMLLSRAPSSPWEIIQPPQLCPSLEISSDLLHSKIYCYLHREATWPSFTNGLYVIKSRGFSLTDLIGTPGST